MNEKRCMYCQSLVVRNEQGNERKFPYYCWNCDEEMWEEEVYED